MPILRGSVTFSRYHAVHAGKAPADVKRWLLKGLKSQAFEPLDPRSDEDRAAGFAELEHPDSVEFAPSALFYRERALFTWRVDTLKVSASAVRDELTRWAQAFEAEQGRKPTRVERAHTRAALRQKLRSQAVPVTKTHDVAWNLETDELQLWSSSRKVVEELSGAIEAAFEVRLLAPAPTALAAAGEDLRPTASLIGLTEEVTHGAA